MVIVIVVETKSTVDRIFTVVLTSDSKNYTLYTSPFGSRSDRFSVQGYGLHSGTFIEFHSYGCDSELEY